MRNEPEVGMRRCGNFIEPYYLSSILAIFIRFMETHSVRGEAITRAEKKLNVSPFRFVFESGVYSTYELLGFLLSDQDENVPCMFEELVIHLN